jgi:phosphatidylglycerol:prolipoprotein diacylglycerol transferase
MNDAAGVARWPSALVELLFNAVMLGVVLLLRRRKILPGQHFHIYLMAYGVFRFFHEFLRDTPRILGPISGYQIVALAVAALGAMGFVLRQRQSLRPGDSTPTAANQEQLI